MHDLRFYSEYFFRAAIVSAETEIAHNSSTLANEDRKKESIVFQSGPRFSKPESTCVNANSVTHLKKQ